jgi:small-conductance mechanosensitive channel
VDLQEKLQVETAARTVATVRKRARPWRYIIGLIVAIAAYWLAEIDPFFKEGTVPHTLVRYIAVGLICLIGVGIAVGLFGKVRTALEPVIGSAHAAVVRYMLVLISGFAIIVTSLALLHIDVRQLLLGGAVAGVILGIAAQQALGNVFAGLVLLLARPFNVGDRVRIRAGALSGTIEGTLVEISITYVRLQTADGPLYLPNSMVLAAAVGPATPESESAAADGSTAQTAGQDAATAGSQEAPPTAGQGQSSPSQGGPPVSQGAPPGS